MNVDSRIFLYYVMHFFITNDFGNAWFQNVTKMWIHKFHDA